MNIWKRFRWVWGAIAVILSVTFFTIHPLTGQAQSTGNTQLHWYGQSAYKITTPTGKVLLVDPWINNPGNSNAKEDLANLNQVDLILVTHGHGDHVGDAVEIGKKTKAKLVTTFDLGKAMVAFNGYPEDLVGFETQGNFGGELNLLNGEVKVAFIPAVHSSAIGTDGNPANYAGNPGGFLISVNNGPSIYHTGDTDLFADMSLIPQFRKVDVMLACIGDKFTMGPSRAAEALKLVNPGLVIPMHYGLFNLPGTPEAFSQALKQQGIKTPLRVMKVGETLKL